MFRIGDKVRVVPGLRVSGNSPGTNQEMVQMSNRSMEIVVQDIRSSYIQAGGWWWKPDWLVISEEVIFDE